MLGFGDLFLLFFPSNCLLCGKGLSESRAVLCFTCELNMPKTSFKDYEHNPVCQIFWGRIQLRAGISLFRFEKGSAYQALIHDLKYRGNKRAGLYLGRMLGQELRGSILSDCDLMVPVPLHQKRLRQRGYNQSELIARGVSEITGIPVAGNLIRRKKYQHSQTTKNRQERFQNMLEAFILKDSPPDLNGKKILIIDDIVTTGATLEACSRIFLNAFKCTVFFATVSYA